jgi:hypothetical protein
VTTDRAKAYRLVLRLLDALGPARLRAADQAAVREAADALLFSTGAVPDADARDALGRLREVLDGLVAEGRFTHETADGIADAVEACGPAPVAARS